MGAQQANPVVVEKPPSRSTGCQAFASELPSFKKSAEEERQRYDDKCEALKRKLASETGKEAKQRMAAERGQVLAQRDVKRLGERCVGLSGDVAEIQGVHTELRGWVEELFELQQTEATRAMLLLQLECERRLSEANERVAAADARAAGAGANASAAESEGLTTLRGIVSELEVSKEVEIAALRAHFDAEQSSMMGALEVAASELAEEQDRASEMASTLEAAEARALEAESAAMDALQLAADAELVVSEAKEAEQTAYQAAQVAKQEATAAFTTVESARDAQRLSEVEAEVEAKVADAAQAEGKVVLGQVHELASEIGSFLQKQRLFEEQRAAANAAAKEAGGSGGSGGVASVKAEMDRVNATLMQMQQQQALAVATGDAVAEAAELQLSGEVTAVSTQLTELQRAQGEAVDRLEATQKATLAAEAESKRLEAELQRKAER